VTPAHSAAQPGAVELLTSDDETPIAVRRLGTGPPVVAIHGGLGTWRSWLPVAERLTDRFEVFLYDRRGRGASGEAPGPHTIELEVADARAVVGAAGADAFVMGHSFGGAIALELARTGVPVGPLVVYEPPAAIGHLLAPGDLAALAAADHPDEILDHGIELLDRAGLVRGGGPARLPSQARTAARTLAPTVAREIAAAASLGSDPGRYADVQQATLVLAGHGSPEPQRAACRQLAHALPHGRLAWLEGHAHVAHTTAPDLVAQQIGGFLG
jgi:pimeloyl-ACP methyl ester carboxylesterase